MSDLDLKIAGGTIIDGTGAPRYTADIGVRDGRVVEIGRVSTPAKRTIDADGALVTPGFIDMHTHYDAQALWDSELIASSRNGITTAVMGNCGVGCAPFVPAIRGDITALLEGVEDVPASALDAGLDWKWRSFGSYLDQVAARPHTINLAANATHAPIRMIAMGERAFDESDPTDDDITMMQALLKEALDSGASAFSTDRIALHRLTGGRHVPDWKTPRREMLALTEILSRYPGRPLQFAADYGGMVGTEEETVSELALLRELAGTGIPIYTPMQQYSVEGGWRRLAAAMDAMIGEGAKITLEAFPRAIGGMMGIKLLFHPFCRHPSYLEIEHLPLDARIARMRDPAFRARILAEQPAMDPASAMVNRKLQMLEDRADSIFSLGQGTPNYEPELSTSIRAIAEREGRPLMEVFYDVLTGGDGHTLLYFPTLNFVTRSLDEQQQILELPNTIFSFGDAGAHLLQVADSAYTSFSLAHWGRDRAKGISLERLVYQMSGGQAALFGFRDRGRIALGSIADINVIDHAALAVTQPELLHDLPGGAGRLVQGSIGYIETLVGGVPIVQRDELTGQLPGAVLRS